MDLSEEFMDEIRPMVGVSMLRLGPNFDGGYLVPQLALSECDALISLGYGYDSSFERGFLELNRKKSVNLYDSNINLYSSVKILFRSLGSVVLRGRGFPILHSKQLLNYLFVLFNQRINYKVGKIGHLSDSKCLNLLDTFKASTYKKIILKMDIEGSEYESLDLDIHYLGRFQCLIIEFHDIESRIEDFLSITNNIKKDFTLINTHINNNGPIVNGIPQVVELCFIRSSLIANDSLKRAESIPHLNDFPNDPSKPEITYKY